MEIGEGLGNKIILGNRQKIETKSRWVAWASDLDVMCDQQSELRPLPPPLSSWTAVSLSPLSIPFIGFRFLSFF